MREETVFTEALGHDYASAGVTKAATCAAAGSEQLKCSRCGQVAAETLPALGHQWSEWRTTKAASTLSTGVQERSCARCEMMESKPIEMIPKASQSIKVGKIAKKFKGVKRGNAKALTGNRRFKLSAKAEGTLSYQKISGSKKIKVGKSGAVTVKKGLKACLRRDLAVGNPRYAD